MILELPGWGGPERLDGFSVMSAPAGALPDAELIATPEGRVLRFTVGATLFPPTIPAGTHVEVHIADALGITLPAAGLSRTPGCAAWPNEGCPILVSTISAAGDVYPTPVTDYLPIGMFNSSAVACSPKVAGALTAVTLSFEYSRALTPGDVFALSIAAFTTTGGRVVGATPVGGANNSFTGREMAWSSDAGVITMRFTVARQAPPYAPQRIDVPLAAGFLLPGNGISLDQPTFMRIQATADQDSRPARAPARVRARPRASAATAALHPWF